MKVWGAKAGPTVADGASQLPVDCSAAISCTSLYKWFGSSPVLVDVHMRVDDHEFVCIVGPSGCGKTTLLRLVAGLVHADYGEIRIGRELIRNPSPQVAVVFQHVGLFPWKTVYRNVALPLEVSGVAKAEVARRVEAALALVNLPGVDDRYPAQLSGGMKQRVGLARALVVEPAVLLLDEPFAALDAQSREILQEELMRIWAQSRQTSVFITHSIDEAITLADRIIVMGVHPGRIIDDIRVPISRPRTVNSVRHEPAYANLREKIWTELHQGTDVRSGRYEQRTI